MTNDPLATFMNAVRENLYTESDLSPGAIDKVVEIVEMVFHNYGYEVTQGAPSPAGRPPPPPIEWAADLAEEPAHGPRSWRWWHRLRGHKTRSRYDLIAPPYAWECEDCDVMFGHF